MIDCYDVSNGVDRIVAKTTAVVLTSRKKHERKKNHTCTTRFGWLHFYKISYLEKTNLWRL